ncbi:hypothetical protein CA51_13200 [Rosistilla oblonga]|nr:hypothetical protein CA51_13200 [Rosistilla oblonga]
MKTNSSTSQPTKSVYRLGVVIYRQRHVQRVAGCRYFRRGRRRNNVTYSKQFTGKLTHDRLSKEKRHG